MPKEYGVISSGITSEMDGSYYKREYWSLMEIVGIASILVIGGSASALAATAVSQGRSVKEVFKDVIGKNKGADQSKP